MFQSIAAIIRRDAAGVLHRRSGWIEPLLFFTVVTILFPLSMAADPQKILQFGPSVVWIATLLSGFLSLERFLHPDYENGSLEQLLLVPQPLGLLLFAKVISHWLINGVPLAIVAGLYAGLLFLPSTAIPVLILALLMGTLTITLIGAIGAALTVPLRQGSMLTGLLVLPLYLPPLIFGTQLSEAAVLGLPISGYFALLGAMLILASVLAPICAAAALRVVLD